MDLLKRFENPALVRGLADRIAETAQADRQYTLMEVCGTHTQSIGRWGLRSILPDSIRLVSGPGCPVCVTGGEYIDNACRLGLEEDVLLCTFGDMLRVPGNETSLEEAQAEGADLRILYSPGDALAIAKQTRKEVVFLAIGFETTIAANAAAIRAAHESGQKNLSFYLAQKIVPPALAALMADPELAIDGFILPGHVSVIIGADAYGFLLDAGVPGVIAGFEPTDILHAVLDLVRMINEGAPTVVNQYAQVVRPEGNPAARKLFETFFDVRDEVWRGLGTIPASGHGFKEAFAHLDAERRFGLGPISPALKTGCSCGRVLKGMILPDQCPLFGTGCTPVHPVGPCMVSNEGSCAAYYKYRSA